MRTHAARKAANKKFHDLVLRRTIGRLSQAENWTKQVPAVDKQGAVCKFNDPRAVRRSATGWLQYIAYEHASSKSEAAWAVMFIGEQFIKVRGISIEDMELYGRDQVVRGLHAVAAIL